MGFICLNVGKKKQNRGVARSLLLDGIRASIRNGLTGQAGAGEKTQIKLLCIFNMPQLPHAVFSDIYSFATCSGWMLPLQDGQKRLT